MPRDSGRAAVPVQPGRECGGVGVAPAQGPSHVACAHGMVTMVRVRLPLLLLTMLLATGLAGCFETGSDDSPPNAIISVSSRQVDIGEAVEVDGSSSSDPDGDPLTFEWDWDDSNGLRVDARGEEASHSYTRSGTYTITLTVSDGTHEDTATREIRVLGESEAPPEADCGAPQGSGSTAYYLETIVENKADSDRTIEETTQVTLDGRGSTAEGTESWLESWSWDLSAKVDSDRSGDPDDDPDASGELFEWNDVAPGEYPIALTVTDSDDLDDTDSCYAFVNLQANWGERQMPGASIGGDPALLDFDYPVQYDLESGNTISQVRIELVYLTIDDDNPLPGQPEQRNHLDLYVENDTGEDVVDTSSMSNDTRDARNCDGQTEDDSCVFVTLSSSTFRTNLGGEWKVNIQNDNVRDATIKSMTIWLTYKR